MRPLPSLQLRRLLLRHLSTSPSPPLQTHIPFLSIKSTHFLNSQPTITSSHPKPFSSFSTRPALHPNPAQLSQSLATELLRDSNSDAPSVTRRLQSTFPRFTPSPPLIQSLLHLSAAADRRAILGCHTWLISNPNLDHGDQIVEFFGQRRDFKSANDVIHSGKNFGELVRAGRISQAIGFLENLESKHGIKMEIETVKLAAERVCEETWNVVISCLCKIRKTQEALSLFNRMCGMMSDGEKGFQGPNETTYVACIREGGLRRGIG